MNILLRYIILSFICCLAAFPILLVAGRLGVTLGWVEQHTVFGLLKFTLALGLGSGILGTILWGKA